jgi:hypothetical protein
MSNAGGILANEKVCLYTSINKVAPATALSDYDGLAAWGIGAFVESVNLQGSRNVDE